MRDRTWNIDELVDAYERKGIIDVPFTPDERALVQSVAAAWHFCDVYGGNAWLLPLSRSGVFFTRVGHLHGQ